MRTRHVVAALGLATLAACSSSSGSSNSSNSSPTPLSTTPAATTPAGAGAIVPLAALSGNRWSVSTLSLKVGDSVKVTDNDPNVPHNFTVAGVGHSPTMNQGETFTLRFDKAGDYDFVCTFHQSQGMEGTITVR